MKFVSLLNIPPGLLLFAAAMLKCYQLFQNPVAFGELWGVAIVGVLVLNFEFIVGWLLLFPGILSNRAKPTGIVVYGFLFIYTLWARVSGEASCGCLGLIEVPITMMSLIDLGMLISLVAWHPPKSGGQTRRLNSRGVIIILMVFSVFNTGLLTFLASNIEVRYIAASDKAVGDFIAEGEFVYIKPEDWLGEKFPLGRYVNCDDVFQGNWTIVFYNEGCPKCKNLFQKIFNSKGEEKYLLVEVSTSKSANNDSEYIKWRTLPETHEWFVQSPKIIELSEGIVKTVN